MAYQTGTTTGQADLFAKILAFATANGWTNTGTASVPILGNGNGFVRLSMPTTTDIKIEGCNDTTFAGNGYCAQANRMSITNWPASATYYAFALTNPNMIWVVLQYLVPGEYQYCHQYIAFGDVTSLSGFVGTNWFAATHSYSWQNESHDENVRITTTSSGSRSGGTQNTPSGGLFWDDGSDSDNWDGGFGGTRVGYLHIEVDGQIWPGCSGVTQAYPACATGLNPMHAEIVSNFDDEQCLLPYLLTLRRPDGNYSDVAFLPHIRMARLDNWSPGDIVTVDGTSYMLFSWMKRDDKYPNGATASTGIPNSVGLWAYAVEYVP